MSPMCKIDQMASAVTSLKGRQSPLLVQNLNVSKLMNCDKSRNEYLCILDMGHRVLRREVQKCNIILHVPKLF